MASSSVGISRQRSSSAIRRTKVVGKPITILYPSDRLAEASEILGRVRRGERVDHYETVRRRKDGSLVNVSLTVSPIKEGEAESSVRQKSSRTSPSASTARTSAR
jgi:hypothetical protein